MHCKQFTNKCWWLGLFCEFTSIGSIRCNRSARHAFAHTLSAQKAFLFDSSTKAASQQAWNTICVGKDADRWIMDLRYKPLPLPPVALAPKRWTASKTCIKSTVWMRPGKIWHVGGISLGAISHTSTFVSSDYRLDQAATWRISSDSLTLILVTRALSDTTACNQDCMFVFRSSCEVACEVRGKDLLSLRSHSCTLGTLDC